MDKRHPVRKFLTALVETNALIFGRKTPLVRRYEIAPKGLPAGFDGCRIAQISDLHARRFGKGQKNLLEVLRRERPDFILVTGDLLECEYGRERTIVTDMLKGLPAIAPTFFSLGNHETRSDDGILSAELADIQAAGLTLLDGDVAELSRGGDRLALGGIWVKPECPLTEPEPVFIDRERASLDAVAGKCGDRFLILMAHRPECIEMYKNAGAGLVFSGHAHGGLMPWGQGALIAPGQGWRPKITKGLYVSGDTTMVVSAGLGGPRIFIAPEIPVVTLKVIHN